MLNAVIRFSLRQRTLVIVLAVFLLVSGVWQASRMPIDVFPDLNRPRVVLMTEAPGMAPEEVETLITIPLETALNGANGVQAVRSSSSVGISVITIEFDWETNIFTDRQIVTERVQLVADRLPAGTVPHLAPVSSIMGQILMLAMYRDGSDGVIPRENDLDLRTDADWVVRKRLLTIPGVAQVFTMGGGRKQFQILVNPDNLLRYGVTLHEVKQALLDSNVNGTGGYLQQQGPDELLVRTLGRIQTIRDLENVVVTIRKGKPVALAQIADVAEAGQVKRGDSSAFLRQSGDDWLGGPAVVLTINKQPGADTRIVSRRVLDAVAELQQTLPDNIRIEPVYAQMSFIDRAINNVVEALRDGSLLVILILFLFLQNLRTTFITLTAIPLSLVLTSCVFAILGLSINTMTLGGLAVAIGELVDDAIVDVENIHRRLQENGKQTKPRNPLLVVFQASTEVRNSIVFGTIIVILVFLPLFALSGMEGRLFTPLGIAYIVSILSSLAISLTVTPVLAYWLLNLRKAEIPERDGPLLRVLKFAVGLIIRFSLRFPFWNLTVTAVLVVIAGMVISRVERDFLPPFNEGSIQLNVILPPGSSLATSTRINHTVERRLREVPGIERFVRRTGRAELDEHVEGVHASEYVIELSESDGANRQQQLNEIREAMDSIPGIVTAVEQPIAHLISHMLSGVKAQVGIKIYGDNLEELRRQAALVEETIRPIVGITDLFVEPQVTISQLRIELSRDRLLLHGLTAAEVNELIATAMNGEVLSEIVNNQRSFDLLLRLREEDRENLDQLRRLAIETPEGGSVPLESVARIYESGGPNAINREQVRRRIVIQCNVSGRGVVDVVEEIKEQLQPVIDDFPSGYFMAFEGQFESQQTASRIILLLFLISLAGVFFVLFTLFRSVNLSLQVMAALPMSFIGAVVALIWSGQTLSIASLVGFVSLAGIASRNGIMLLSHYLHLVRHEGEEFSFAMIERAGKERLAPVLMTAMTSGIGLVPLVLSAGEPGKEILYPVATVILGGLVSSTLLDFFVHPALFWCFGRQAARRVLERSRQPIKLEIEPDPDE